MAQLTPSANIRWMHLVREPSRGLSHILYRSSSLDWWWPANANGRLCLAGLFLNVVNFSSYFWDSCGPRWDRGRWTASLSWASVPGLRLRRRCSSSWGVITQTGRRLCTCGRTILSPPEKQNEKQTEMHVKLCKDPCPLSSCSSLPRLT